MKKKLILPMSTGCLSGSFNLPVYSVGWGEWPCDLRVVFAPT